MRRALTAAGLPAATIAAELARLPGPAEPEWVDLDADDEGKTVALFLALDASWHRAGIDGERVGLINSEIVPTATLLPDVTVTPAVFVDLRAMATEALKTFAANRPRPA